MFTRLALAPRSLQYHDQNVYLAVENTVYLVIFHTGRDMHVLLSTLKIVNIP